MLELFMGFYEYVYVHVYFRRDHIDIFRVDLCIYIAPFSNVECRCVL